VLPGALLPLVGALLADVGHNLKSFYAGVNTLENKGAPAVRFLEQLMP